MNKLLPFVVFFTSSMAHGEPDPTSEHVAVLIKGGASASTLSHEYRERRYGLSSGAGAYLQWAVGERFLVGGQLELLYISRGAEVVFNGESQGELRERYLDVVAAVRPQIKLDRVNLYALLGGGVGFLTKASDQNTAGMSQDVTNNLRRRDILLLGGVGVTFSPFSQSDAIRRTAKIFLEARYDLGLVDIDPMDGGFKNRTMSLFLGLSLGLLPSGNPARPVSSQE